MVPLFARALIIALLVAPLPAAAQQLQTGFADFGQDQSTPIEIEADALEVQDKKNTAVFTGNVTVRQGNAALQTSRLTVVYSQSALPSPDKATAATTSGKAPSTPGDQRISRLEATGEVLLESDGQTATGNDGVIDFDTNTLALNGNVTLTQGDNVVTGDKLTVDLNTGIARVQSTGRVRVLLSPGGNRPN
ncbi:lipopolysaccharide transport periplasmic protein LptA [Acuticoccus sediminis]|uniref:Lipopolysaccharide transport periplasmic protein LptA n=1 Tax=Acuticoccus sediminis TaxID=2184697 RepID=A0A8B2NLE0_9HYPH|nr:LptA/OstA family protein [Acuticoccus sediminis]RAH98413.1 lipopolysaccharide transport periplasmic protein LptA [Acuticoccus sediminis]